MVITRNRDYRAEGAIVVHDLRDALDKAHALGETECFIIGGGQIYKQALLGNMVDTQYITHVDAAPEGTPSTQKTPGTNGRLRSW